MSRAETFIHLYKTMEDLLEVKYRKEGKDAPSVVYQFLSEPEAEPFRIELDMCRQVRNLLTHSANIGGEPAVAPSEPLMMCLERVVDYLKRPPVVIDRATPYEKTFKVEKTDRIMWAIRRMEEKGYSHVPVMEGKRVAGVFSVSTFFTLARQEGLGRIGSGTLIGEIEGGTAFEAHTTERFLFVKPDTTVAYARELFSKRERGQMRTAMMFITENGEASAPLRAILTPWDLMA